jgi:hypothetical protein
VGNSLNNPYKKIKSRRQIQRTIRLRPDEPEIAITSCQDLAKYY